MKPFIMYRLEPFEGFTSNGAGVGGRVTVKVRFVLNKFDHINGSTEKVEAYDGNFTGILQGIVINNDGTRGRMFFNDGVEIVYEPEDMPSITE